MDRKGPRGKRANPKKMRSKGPRGEQIRCKARQRPPRQMDAQQRPPRRTGQPDGRGPHGLARRESEHAHSGTRIRMHATRESGSTSRLQRRFCSFSSSASPARHKARIRLHTRRLAPVDKGAGGEGGAERPPMHAAPSPIIQEHAHCRACAHVKGVPVLRLGLCDLCVEAPVGKMMTT